MNDCLDELAVDSHIDKVRCRCIVIIPETVVDHLKVPNTRSGFDIEGDQTLGKKIIAKTVTTIIVIGRRSGRQVDISELLVSTYDLPDVSVSLVSPRFVKPCISTEVISPSDPNP